MNRFVKIVLVLAFFAGVWAANLHAQPADAAAATVAAADEKVPSAAPAIFNVLGLPVTNSMICTWIVAALILIVVRSTTWNIKEIPTGMQNVIESLVEGWDGLIGDILDKRVTRWVFPFATTFFIFIVISNLTDLIPGVGSIGVYEKGQFEPLFRPPTTDANLTVAMALIFLVMSLYWAVRYNGFLGLIKHIFGVKMETNKYAYPLFFLLFVFIGAMELLSVVFASHDMIFHGKSLIVMILMSSFMYFYETFVCLVQAFVFAMLVVAFVGTLCTHTDEDHGH